MYYNPHRARPSSRKNIAKIILLIALPVAGVAAATSMVKWIGSRNQQTVAQAPKPRPTPLPQVSEADLQQYKPNETGAIMVLMYHDVDPKRPNDDLNRTPRQFRSDLESLYALGYYPVTAAEVVENNMDVPAGKTPVVLSFDDSKPTQFNIIIGRDGQPHIDPECAVGIMETFNKKKPDWPTKATFFVLPKEGPNYDPFGQPEYVQDKFDYLLKKGYEVANHSSTHANMRGMSPVKVSWEIATAVREIKQVAPKATMHTIALPYGKLPRGESAQKSLISGSHGGTSYKNKAIFLAAWRPILSPVTKADKKLTQAGTLCLFDPYRLERITPDARKPKEPGTMEYWLRYFLKNPSLRYRSDGNLNVVAVPASHATNVDQARVKAQGKVLQVYGGGASATKGSNGSSSLSVESNGG